MAAHTRRLYLSLTGKTPDRRKNMLDRIRRLKGEMRVQAAALRAEQPDPDQASRMIFQHVAALPEYEAAGTIMLYLDIRTEVRTRWFVPSVWEAGKRAAIPYCENGEIELFDFTHPDELAPGTMGVLEPKQELRGIPSRKIDPSELDMIIVPGLAFDRRGNRLGYGKGYYDKLLHRTSGPALKAGVCFECQLFDEVPALPHDMHMDAIVTEKSVYRVPCHKE